MTFCARKTVLATTLIAALYALPLHAAPAVAQTTQTAPTPPSTIVEFSAEASRSVANDLFRASVIAEASGATPGELARQVNALIAEALKTARLSPSIKAQSAGTSSAPIYGKNNKIEGWRMRSELSLETGDSAALSELLGRLQNTLAVSGLYMQPSAVTRRKVENEVSVDAIAAFKQRASVISEAMGKKYRIKQITVHTGNRGPQPLYRAAAKTMVADAAPMPVEGGESTITATVTGQIELE